MKSVTDMLKTRQRFKLAKGILVQHHMLKCVSDWKIYQTCIFLIDHWSPNAIHDMQNMSLIMVYTACLQSLLTKIQQNILLRIRLMAYQLLECSKTTAEI